MILRLGTPVVLALAVLGCGSHAQSPTQAMQGGMSLEVSVAPDSRSGLPSPVWVTVSLGGGQILGGNLVMLDGTGAVLVQSDVPAGARVREQLTWSPETQLARRLEAKLTVRDTGGTEHILETALAF